MNTPINVAFRNPYFDFRTKDSARYVLEAYGTQREAKTGFGQPLLHQLFAAYPHFLDYAAWFSDKLQREDTFLVIDSPERPFAVQIDPDSEHIIVWDSSGFHIELGYWLDNPDEDAFRLISSRYASSNDRNGYALQLAVLASRRYPRPVNEPSEACPEHLRLAFHELLYHSVLCIRGNSSDSNLVFVHADHIHNIPGLLSRFSPDLLKFYWEIERPCFLHNLPPGSTAPTAFQPYWAIIEQEYKRLCMPTTEPK